MSGTRLANEIVLPDIFNLGVAPPAPQGALKYAQRVRLAPPYALDTIVARNWAGSGPLILNAFYLPPIGWTGDVPLYPFTNQLMPNPYAAPQW